MPAIVRPAPSKENAMLARRKLLLRIVVILRIRVKIVR
jgi:hypothetical protein